MPDPRSTAALLVAFALAAAAPATADPPPLTPLTPLTLHRAAELAAELSPELAVARAAEDEGAAASRIAADAFHPEAYLTTTPGYGRGLPVAVAGRVPALVGVELRRTLYDPERRADRWTAQVGEAAARANAERARREAVRAAAELYARCWADAHLLAGAERRQAAFTRLRERAEALHREGRLTDLELAQARLREARARLRESDLMSEGALDRMELRRLTGWPEEAPLALGEDPAADLPTPSGDDLAAAEENDPELRSQTQAIELMGHAAEMRRRAFAPVVEAAAQYSRLATYNDVEQYYRTFKADDWSVGVSIALPLWTGGRAGDAAAQTAARLSRLTEERRARQAELAAQVRRAVEAQARAQAAADLGRQSVAVAEEARRVAGALAAEGRAAPEEIEAREAELADAEEEAARSSAALAAARIEILALRGDLPGASPAPAP
jgi:outer membrane protein TolC